MCAARGIIQWTDLADTDDNSVLQSMVNLTLYNKHKTKQNEPTTITTKQRS